MTLFAIFFSAIFTNNIVLMYFLGICPYLSMSRSLSTAIGMGLAVTFVMVTTTAFTWPIYYYVLIPFEVQYLQYVVFILVIATLVQVVEAIIERWFSVLYANMGIFLPLITVNCAILGVVLFMILREYRFVQSVVFAAGCGAGWTLAIMAMAGIRSKLRFSSIPAPLEGMGITLIIAALMALGFMGFAGWIS